MSALPSAVSEEKAKKEGEGELQTVAVLPPALRCLVFLWEELTTSCMQVSQLKYYSIMSN